MTYALKQDMIDRFGETELAQLTDRADGAANFINDVVLGRALSDATGLIDSYLGKRYALPVSPVPSTLVKVCADIARYYLYGDRAEKDDAITRAYGEAARWLDGVARGVIAFEANGIEAAQDGGGDVRIEGPDRVFTRDTMRGY